MNYPRDVCCETKENVLKFISKENLLKRVKLKNCHCSKFYLVEIYKSCDSNLIYILHASSFRV